MGCKLIYKNFILSIRKLLKVPIKQFDLPLYAPVLGIYCFRFYNHFGFFILGGLIFGGLVIMVSIGFVTF